MISPAKLQELLHAADEMAADYNPDERKAVRDSVLDSVAENPELTEADADRCIRWFRRRAPRHPVAVVGHRVGRLTSFQSNLPQRRPL